jgi:hypothetical protein
MHASAPRGTRRLSLSQDAASIASVGAWNLTCKFGELEISFKPSGTDGYEDLVRTAFDSPARGLMPELHASTGEVAATRIKPLGFGP